MSNNNGDNTMMMVMLLGVCSCCMLSSLTPVVLYFVWPDFKNWIDKNLLGKNPTPDRYPAGSLPALNPKGWYGYDCSQDWANCTKRNEKSPNGNHYCYWRTVGNTSKCCNYPFAAPGQECKNAYP